MALNPFVRGGDSHPLVVGMVGTKMGERFVQIGCAHGGRLGAVAAKVGLSGRAVAITPDEASAERARKGAAQAGMLVEVEVAPMTALPVEDNAFDVAVVDDTGGLLGAMRPEDRGGLVARAASHSAAGRAGRRPRCGPAERSGRAPQARAQRTVVCRRRARCTNCWPRAGSGRSGRSPSATASFSSKPLKPRRRVPL